MYERYTITRDPDTGLMIVRYDGDKIGSSQTEAAAKIIRRKHYQRHN
ncbi:hypothetical protein [Streptomyces sp. S1]